MFKRVKQNIILTGTIILGILTLYIMQIGPSSILVQIKQGLSIENEVLMNLVVNIVFCFIVIGCFLGPHLEKRIGTKGLYTTALIFSALGVLSHIFAADSYMVILAGRSIFGIGFGLAVPFIGSAIMKWYDGDSRERMDTVNALFPFIGTTIAFLSLSPLTTFFNGHWEAALAVWCVPMFICLILWKFGIKEKDIPVYSKVDDTPAGNGVYIELFKRKELRLLCGIFICDFACYSYIGVILPTYFFEIGGISETAANIIAAVAFPVFGMIGSMVGGQFNSKFKRRKPILCVGQIGKFIGLLIVCRLYEYGFFTTILGISVFGFFNGFWMPVMYCIPMDLDNMSSAKVGAAFALMTACGIAAGFFAPSLGGVMTQMFMRQSSAENYLVCHTAAIRQSLWIFSFANILSLALSVKIRETGRENKRRESYEF